LYSTDGQGSGRIRLHVPANLQLGRSRKLEGHIARHGRNGTGGGSGGVVLCDHAIFLPENQPVNLQRTRTSTHNSKYSVHAPGSQRGLEGLATNIIPETINRAVGLEGVKGVRGLVIECNVRSETLHELDRLLVSRSEFASRDFSLRSQRKTLRP
jgi:hypothetical protein